MNLLNDTIKHIEPTVGLVATPTLVARAWNPLVVAIAAFAGLYFCHRPAHGWGEKGHRIVAIIADGRLSEQSQKEIRKLLPAGTTLADAATWPDAEGRRITEFNQLHYVTIPDDADGYDQERDCKDRNCMVEALKWFTSVLSDTTAPLNTQLIALRFVIHLIGDMHQPLHAGRSGDRNGTDITVSHRGHSNTLHLFWDINLVEMMEGNTYEIAKELDSSLSTEELTSWHSGNPKTWTDESFKLSRSYAYNLGESTELADGYVADALPIVRRRILQAGVRLSWVLNNTFK
jgi:S1/P1 Nuclease